MVGKDKERDMGVMTARDGEEDGGRRNFGGGPTVTVRDSEEDGET